MNAYGLRKTLGFIVVLLVVATATDKAVAQRYYQHHHHHDAAGHMIDHAGHHIDAYGRHTGAVGVYHNQYGQYIYQQPGYSQNYGVYANQGYGNYANTVPQNVVPYSLSANGSGMMNGGLIKIFNPPDSGGDVKYSLNGTAYSIKPGSTQSLQYDRIWTVEFGSGGAAGNVRYSLEPGTYKFKVTDAGWNLFKARDQTAVTSIPPAPIPNIDSVGDPRPGIVP